MLSAIGVERVEDLFADVPPQVRFPDLNLPPGISEMEVAAEFRRRAGENAAVSAYPCFLGAGAYYHYTPAVIPHLLFRSELYTSYTPYQPEISQGTLQVIFEYQSMVCRLLGQEVANASMYDGSTALAEAALMTARLARTRRRTILVSAGVHPEYRQVLATYLRGMDLKIVQIPLAADGTTDLAAVRVASNQDTACLLAAYPNFYGTIEPLSELAEVVHAAGGLLAVTADPIACARLRPPGQLGADITTAEGQPLGLPLFFGGPYVGLFATRQEFVRQMPGRITGVAADTEGRRGFVLTLKTREQDIRREKSTSNICTNEALIATAVTMYLAAMGPAGLQDVADHCYHKSHYLAGQLTGLPGVELATTGHFFREFAVRTPMDPQQLTRRLWEEHRILGGLPVGRLEPAHADWWLLTATEMNTRQEMDRLVSAVAGILDDGV